MRFATGASWVVDEPIPVQYFQWPELTATPDGMTDFGAALRLLARDLRADMMPGRVLPPVLVALTDGYPTDDFAEGLETLLREPWGPKAVRIGICIGRDCDYDVLRRFSGNPQLAPLQARNADELVRLVWWASTSVLQAASSPDVGAETGAELRPPAGSQRTHDLVAW